MKTYVMKVGDLYVGVDGLLTPHQADALRVITSADGPIRPVRLRVKDSVNVLPSIADNTPFYSAWR